MTTIRQDVSRPRTVERLVAGRAASDGAGVKLVRVLDNTLQRRLDPFLMLDAFGSDQADDYLAGFPDHPHRGFETVTYMIAGRMRHRDSAGNEGLLENGGVQWMTAGRGVIHSEMPEQEEGRMEGFQLWLNLAGRDKMREPWYRDFKAGEIPEVRTADGVLARVIAGRTHGVAGAVERDVTEPLYLDLEFDGAGRFAQPLPALANAFVYVYRGSARVGGRTVPAQTMGLLANDADSDGVIVETDGPARVLLIAGMPLGEPIAQYGPFVMNTQQQLMEAFDDYRAGRFAPVAA